MLKILYTTVQLHQIVKNILSFLFSGISLVVDLFFKVSHIIWFKNQVTVTSYSLLTIFFFSPNHLCSSAANFVPNIESPLSYPD